MEFKSHKYLPGCQYPFMPLLEFLSDSQNISHYTVYSKVYSSTMFVLHYGGNMDFHEPMLARFRDYVV